MAGVYLNDVDIEFTPERMIASSGGIGVHSLGHDDQLYVYFCEKRVPIESKSLDGIIHFETQDFVHIERPGDKSWIIERKARETDKKRFPMHWVAYKNKTAVVGTPIRAMFEQNLLTEAQIDMLEYAKIKTVEQAVAAGEAIVDAWGPDGRKIQQLAKGFLNFKAQIEGKSDIASLRKELADKASDMQAKSDALDAKMKELDAKLAAMTQKDNKKEKKDKTELNNSEILVKENL